MQRNWRNCEEIEDLRRILKGSLGKVVEADGKG